MTTPPDIPRLDRDAGRDTVDPAPEKEREAPARLSLTQIAASALAAVSTTLLLSYFGTAGTIIGAGIASALTVVANYIYTRSIQKTREQLVPVVGKVVQVTTGVSTPRGRGATAIVSVPRGTGADVAATTLDDRREVADGTGTRRPDVPTSGVQDPDEPTGGEHDTEGDTPQNAWLRLVDRYGRGRVLTVTALALFVAVMGIVLVVELAIGKPISDAVRGVEGSGTTIGSSNRSTGTEDPATPAPSTTTPAEDPSTVPTQDPTPTPTTTPTDEPTTTPTDEPTEEPDPDPTTSPDPEPSPSPSTGDGSTGTGSGSEGETGTGGSAETVPTPAPSTPATS